MKLIVHIKSVNILLHMHIELYTEEQPFASATSHATLLALALYQLITARPLKLQVNLSS